MSEWTRGTKGQTLILTDRRGTSEGSRILRTNGKSTKNVKKIASRSESSRSRNVSSKNDKNRSENRSKIVENRVPGPLGRPFRSTSVARSSKVERLGATRGVSERLGERLQRPSQSKWVGRGRSGRPGRAGRPEASDGNSNRDYIILYNIIIL